MLPAASGAGQWLQRPGGVVALGACLLVASGWSQREPAGSQGPTTGAYGLTVLRQTLSGLTTSGLLRQGGDVGGGTDVRRNVTSLGGATSACETKRRLVGGCTGCSWSQREPAGGFG